MLVCIFFFFPYTYTRIRYNRDRDGKNYVQNRETDNSENNAVLTVETDEELGHVLDGDHAAVVEARRRRRGRFAAPAAVDAAAAGRVQRLLPDEGAHGRASGKGWTKFIGVSSCRRTTIFGIFEDPRAFDRTSVTYFSCDPFLHTGFTRCFG